HHLESGEDHSVLPEADDVSCRCVEVTGIERPQLLRVVGPAESRERPETRGEPRVQYIGRTRQLARPTLAARLGDRLLDGGMTVRALPHRQLVTPPDLSRDVPVGCVLERLDGEAVLRLRVVANAAAAQRLERRLLQLRHRAPPLQRDTRLDPGLAAVADSNGVSMRLTPLELAVFFEPRENPLVGLFLREPGKLAGLLVHPTVRTDDRDLREAVVDPDFVVQRVVARRYFECAGAEVALDALIGDHGDPPPDHRHDHLAADELAVTTVVRMHGNRDVRED